ncbi:MAG: TetR/AcrR family transcriptional regulator [Betaproteobacteria bacterium]|nr:MAG: TetR/AcrR family transcriptional regulator [Betaproteobacteria bacterium]
MAQKPAAQRLTREEWLSRALHALAKQGERVLTIDTLTRQLGVSRGSFYWHFKDRADFVSQLAEYWFTTHTQIAAEQLANIKGNAEDRLLALMEKIIVGKLARYDFAVRAWAKHDPAASRIVRKADQFRIDYVRSLFAEIGFKGEELDMRTRAFVVYFSLESGLFIGQSKQSRVKQLKRLHAFFTRP